MKAKSIFDSYSDEQLSDLMAKAEVTAAGNILFEERFINPNAVDVEFIYDWTAQPREETNGRGLVDSIRRIGQQERPILVKHSGKELPEVGRGHRRLNAACIISKEFSDDFVRLYPNGVPVKVAIGKMVKGKTVELTGTDMHLLRADHDLDDLKQSLSSKIECVRLTRPLFNLGLAMIVVIEHTWRTVSRIMSSKYNALREEIEKTSNRQEQLRILDRSQHGNFQFLKAIADSPNALYEAWATGEKQEGPVLTQKVVKELASQFRNAVKDSGQVVGGEVITKENPGPDWTESLKDAVTEAGKPKEEKEKGPAMAKKSKVEEMLEKATSQTARLAFQATLGITGAERMLQNDYDVPVRAFEQMREVRPRLMEAMLELATTLDGDITKEQYKAVNAVFPNESVHVDAAKEATPKTPQAAAKGGRKGAKTNKS